MADHKHDKHEHYILPNRNAVAVGVALLILTVITVAVAQVDLGRLNFPVAMLVATIKACLVAVIFMNLRHDTRENAVIFATSFVFLAIFMVLTGFDLFFRPGDAYFRKPIADASAVAGPAKFERPWVSKPEMLAWAQPEFAKQCASCHGAAGKGDGAASGGFNPKPRDFTGPGDGWKNGRKPSQVFLTLKSGLNQMPSFATLPAEDRWALAHYVLSLGPAIPADDGESLAKAGVDPKGGAATELPTLPIDFAMDRVVGHD